MIFLFTTLISNWVLIFKLFLSQSVPYFDIMYFNYLMEITSYALTYVGTRGSMVQYVGHIIKELGGVRSLHLAMLPLILLL